MGNISETLRCRMLIHGRDIGKGCMCVISWYDLSKTYFIHNYATIDVTIISSLVVQWDLFTIVIVKMK